MTITEDAIRDIIRYYTREAGVQNLERELATIARKAVKEILLAKGKKKKLEVSSKIWTSISVSDVTATAKPNSRTISV